MALSSPPLHPTDRCRECFFYLRHAQQTARIDDITHLVHHLPSTVPFPSNSSVDLNDMDGELARLEEKVRSAETARKAADRLTARYRKEISWIRESHREEVLALQDELRRVRGAYQSLADGHIATLGELYVTQTIQEVVGHVVPRIDTSFSRPSFEHVYASAASDDFEIYQQLQMIYDTPGQSSDSDVCEDALPVSASKSPSSAPAQHPSGDPEGTSDVGPALGSLSDHPPQKPLSGSTAPLTDLPSSLSIYVDACSQGLGFVCGSFCLSWRFKDPKTNPHIPRGGNQQIDQTWAELLGIEAGIATAIHAATVQSWRIEELHVYCDNSGIVLFLSSLASLRIRPASQGSAVVTVFKAGKESGIKTKKYLVPVVDRILNLCIQKNIRLNINWIPTSVNLADKPSRGNCAMYLPFPWVPPFEHLKNILSLPMSLSTKQI